MTTTARDRMKQYIAKQDTHLLLGSLATLESAGQDADPIVLVQIVAIQTEIEARLTPEQQALYDQFVDERWDEIADWTQARLLTEVLTAA